MGIICNHAKFQSPLEPYHSMIALQPLPYHRHQQTLFQLYHHFHQYHRLNHHLQTFLMMIQFRYELILAHHHHSQKTMVIIFIFSLINHSFILFFHVFQFEEFNLPTYDEALLMNQDIDINLQRIEESFTKLLYTQTTKR